jgi:hypothetical protein
MSFEAGWVFDDLDNILDINSVFWGIIKNQAQLDAVVTPAGVGKSIATNYSNIYGAALRLPRALTNDTYWYQAETYFSSASSGWILQLQNYAGSVQGGLFFDSSSRVITAYRGESIALASGDSETISVDMFHRVDVKFKIHGTQGLYEVYFNGNPTPYLSISDVNTQALATDEVGNFYYVGTGYRIFRPVVFNSQGTKNNGRVPANFQHKILYPNSDGVSIWTPNSGVTAHTQIDELQGANDDASTYVGTSVLNAKNICGLTDAADLGTIAAVQLHSRFGRSAPGVIAVKAGIISGANEWQSANRYLPSSYNSYVDILEYETGTTEFTQAKVNALEVTAEVVDLG